MLAAYLISQGHGATAAIQRIRATNPFAIETAPQVAFLHQYARRRPSADGQPGWAWAAV
jgi:protein-tyrosine phosphatase